MKVEIKDKEKNIHYQSDPEKFNRIVSIVEQHFKTYSKFLKEDKLLLEFLFRQTRFLDAQNPSMRGRLHCLFNGISELKLCEQCNEIYVDLSDCRINGKTKRFCSNRCKAKNKSVQEKTQQTMLKRHGVKFALQDKTVLQTAIEKSEQTSLARYGKKHFMQTEEGKDRLKQSNLDKYGVEYNFQIPEVKEQIKETNLEKFGVEYPMMNPDIYEKSRQTCVDKFGTRYPIQCDEVKAKLKKTNLEIYGVEWNIASQNNIEKSKKTNLEKYGTEYPMQSEEVYDRYVKSLEEKHGVTHNMQLHEVRIKQQQKYHAIIFEKYGVLWSMQSPEIQRKAKSKYTFMEIKFDSAPEIALYIYLVDNKIEFEYQPNKSFEYVFNEKSHVYFPDFEINGKLYEIKGDHLVENGKWICPWDRTNDGVYEAKHQCAIKNGVIILYTKDYQKYLDYVYQKYGMDYLSQFKNLSE